MSYLLDTNVCIAFLNQKDAKLRARLEQTSPDDLKLCSVVKAELLYGARNSTRAEHNLSKLARFFELFESVPFDDAAAHQYGALRAQLRRSGTPVGANDMLIAAIALAADLTLVTRNQDELRQVAGLRVDSW
jgi:tRNA(fMet)-specific endonuclease VapC